jgi:SDR family mycofactocin-dependent oxidoreductase
MECEARDLNGNRFSGKVVLISGGARGQGRSHALRFASEGADIVVCDLVSQVPTVGYPMPGPDDLRQTIREVEALGRRCLGIEADVRSLEAMTSVVDSALETFGHVDVAIAQAGVCTFGPIAEMDEQTWSQTIDTNLTGVFNTIRAALPGMIERRTGRILATASMAGRAGWENIGHYAASKWGIIGLVKSVALEVAPFGITANVVCPSSVNTPMMLNDGAYKLFRPDLAEPTLADALPAFTAVNVIPVPYAETADISAAMAFLASDDARYITGAALSVSAGVNARNL